MKRLSAVLVLAFLLISLIPNSVFADGPVYIGTIKTDTNLLTKTVYENTTGNITFSDVSGKYSVSAETYINNIKFIPSVSTDTTDKLVWSTGEKDPSVQFSYEYQGTTLKETIVLKEPGNLSFEITPKKGTVLISWFNGEYKIVEDTFTDTMTGIVISRPYGTDANGNYVPMEYVKEKNTLTLKYDTKLKIRNTSYVIPKDKKDIDLKLAVVEIPVAYPLTIDPTWTLVGSHYEATVGSDTVVMFNTTGTTYYVVPDGVTSIWYLVIAGGGGLAEDYGGAFTFGGGAGAGGVLNGTAAVSAGNNITVIIGSGGGKDANGVNSSIYNSSFGTIASKGGGHGGGYYFTPEVGGSGGGGDGAGGTGAAGVTGQGYAGGNGQNGASASGGGGGGATAVGANGVANSNGGNGGPGFTTSITGESQCLAGGGGGGAENTASYAGGTATCGGGHGDDTQSAGTPATGGGAGAGRAAATTGGSGIVFIRYTPAGGGAPPVASFTVNPMTRIPKAVAVTDTSANTPTSWQWSWGDGTANSTTQSPSHQYTKRGMYTINMAATNADGTGVAAPATVRVVGYENLW